MTGEHLTFNDSKDFLVNAWDDGEQLFFAWESKGIIYSLEHIPNNIPSTTVCSWATIEDFVAGVTWIDWIWAGIKDEKLRAMVDVANKKKWS